MLRVALRLWSLASLFGALGCSAAPVPLPSPPAALSSPPSSVVPNANVRASPPRAATRAAPSVALPLLAPPEPPSLQTVPGTMHASETPLTPARREADFGCEHATDARASPPLHLLELTEPLRLWASTGPAFPTSLVTRRALLSVTTAGTEATTLACGASISVDLEPGRYWVRGQTRTTLQGDSGDSRAPIGFAYRLSALGDGSCPAALATRGIHDWDGEFPFEVSAERVDADAVPDVRVDYQLGYTSAATRLLVTEPYPTCLRVVADGGVARAEPGWTHGHRNYRWAFRPLHPVQGWGGRVITEYDAPYSTTTNSYEVGRFRACHEALPSDSPRSDRARELYCARWLRATDPMTWPDGLVARWLDAAPAARELVPHAASLASEATSALLRALDEEGSRATVKGGAACAPAPQRRDFAFHVALLSTEGEHARDAYVLVTRRPGVSDELAGVFFDSSPCAAEDVPLGAATFFERWLDEPWRAARASTSGAPGIEAAHARWSGASRAARVQDQETSSCATSLLAPASPSWLFTAWVAPAPGATAIGEPTPIYVTVGRRALGFVVLAASDVKPAHCQ